MYVIQLFDRRLTQSFERPEFVRQDSCSSFPYMTDSKAINQVPEVALLTGLDLRQHI